jgi:FdhD protein
MENIKDLTADEVQCITSSYHAIGIERDVASGVEADVCVEESVNLLLNGTRVASLTITPAELEAFAYGYLVCEGLIKSIDEVSGMEIRWPNVDVTVPSFGKDHAGLWMEIRSSGCVGVKSAWNGLEEPLMSTLTMEKDLIFYSLGFINDLARNWKKTGGTHCTIIFDSTGGIISYAEDIGRHNSMDKAVGKALMQGSDLSGCFIVCTGRMAGGMVAKAYRAGVPVLVSNTAPFTTGIDLARKLNMTLICFARPPRMLIYSGKERICGVRPG